MGTKVVMTTDQLDRLLKLDQFFKNNGYTHPRFIHTGKIACIMPLLYTAAIITLDPENYESCYEDRWCYKSHNAASAALDVWQSGEEPLGWHRHPRTGRRRENGDPTTEYINH